MEAQDMPGDSAEILTPLLERARLDPEFRAWLLEQLPPAPPETVKEQVVKNPLPPFEKGV